MSNILLITNGKGGVGKTSLTANLAAGAASAGWNVLAVDLDPQGNLARDLGYLDRSDGGKSLLSAMLVGGTPDVVQGVRPGLDVLPGGPYVAQAGDHLALQASRIGPEALDGLSALLAPLAGGYDLVVCDMPPGDSTLQRAAARMARWVVVPTTPDDAGLDGLGLVYAELAQVGNDQLELLGVALTLVGASSTAVTRRAREQLRELLGESIPVFDHAVRYAQAAAVACRSQGLTAAEYEGRAATAKPWYQARREGQPTERYSSAAGPLAADYQGLIEEVLGAISTSMAENPGVA